MASTRDAAAPALGGIRTLRLQLICGWREAFGQITALPFVHQQEAGAEGEFSNRPWKKLVSVGIDYKQYP